MPDGSWINDVTLSRGRASLSSTAIALAEALTSSRRGTRCGHAQVAWTDAAGGGREFLDGFISIETGNINYPATSTLAFALCAARCWASPLTGTARGKLAQHVMEYFTPDGLLFGEGHPLNGVTPKGCRPVDLGYNVEESLPALALYSLLAGDKAVEQQVVAALETHMEFQLPDGAWDNSWGTRNYKWSWWGSRTSDGCHPGFLLMAGHDPRFREAARRNYGTDGRLHRRRPALRRAANTRRTATFPASITPSRTPRRSPRRSTAAASRPIPSGRRSRAMSPTA